MHIIESPLRVATGKTKYFVLNLNQYRNAHYFTLNNAKKEHKRLIIEQVNKLPAFSKIIIHYMLFPKNKRMCDLDNVISIHAKFFQDVLVECKKIPEDTYEYIIGSTQEFGEINKTNPHVQIKIEVIE